MKNIRINNEIDLNYPDGFNEMSEEELARYFGTPADRWGVFDPVSHTVLSVHWEKAKFYRKLCDAEWYLIDIEGRLRKKLVNYQRSTSYKVDIQKKKKKGQAIRFEYRVNDSVSIHVCDLVVFTHKKNIYFIYYITRQGNAAQTIPAFEEVLKSLALN